MVFNESTDRLRVHVPVPPFPSRSLTRRKRPPSRRYASFRRPVETGSGHTPEVVRHSFKIRAISPSFLREEQKNKQGTPFSAKARRGGRTASAPFKRGFKVTLGPAQSGLTCAASRETVCKGAPRKARPGVASGDSVRQRTRLRSAAASVRFSSTGASAQRCGVGSSPERRCPSAAVAVTCAKKPATLRLFFCPFW